MLERSPMPPPSDKPVSDADRLWHESARDLTADIKRLIDATLDRWTSGFTDAGFDATQALAATLQKRMSESAFLGAKTLLHAYDAALKAHSIPIPEVAHGFTIAPVGATRAVESMLAREPRLARTAAQVADLYAHGKVFALAKSSSLVVTQKVHGAIVAALESGAPSEVASKVIAELGPWSKSYAETGLRTNVMTAYSDGQDGQARAPGIRDVMVGFEIAGPGREDPDTRHNHAAAVGWRASVDDPRWKTMKTPLGFNCRHSRALVDVFRAARNGWLDASGRLVPVDIPAGAGPDEGFRAA